MSKLSWTCFHRSCYIPWCAIYNRTYVSKTDTGWSSLGDLYNSWSTWRNADMVHLFCLEAREISFLIYFATPPELMIVFSLVRAIVLDALGALDTAGHSCMSLSPAILALRNAKVHVGSSNSCNKPPYIETPVNKTFSLTSTLNIPDVNPNNWYIRLRWHFDDIQFWHENNIVEYLILFDNAFNLTWCKTFIKWIMKKVKNTYDFQIRLWLE